MIDISLEQNPVLYRDYTEGLKFLSKIKEEDYEYPQHTTLFHTYIGQGIQTDKQLECVKSFLATQNLNKTKMILWSDTAQHHNKLIQPYKEYIELRVWDPVVA